MIGNFNVWDFDMDPVIIKCLFVDILTSVGPVLEVFCSRLTFIMPSGKIMRFKSSYFYDGDIILQDQRFYRLIMVWIIKDWMLDVSL